MGERISAFRYDPSDMALRRIDPAPRAVIFDMDGTLGDTFDLIVEAFNEACRPLIGRPYRDEEVIGLFGIPDASMIKKELLRLGHSDRDADAAVERYHRAYEARHELATVFDGIQPLLDRLRRAQIPLGMMTGKGRRTADITVRKLGWDAVFGSVVTGDDVTHQKPHPEGVLRVARELNVPPATCIFVGDSPADIGAGKAAGMATVVAGWHPVYHEQLRPLEPEYWADTPEDLKRLVLG